MKAEDIFLAALDEPTPQERDAYLRRVCGDDTQLLRLVEGLLRSHQEAEGFLETPFLQPTTLSEPALADGVGSRIGPYTLLERIGEGGMGLVYKAEQKQPIRRLVALKIIKPGMDSQQVIARFEAERQTLAVMNHANIATVLDAGRTPAGSPYFVMELVNGIPITKYCDQQRLTIKARLELFVMVCQAIQHAHHKGIIHRDIKPSNILLALHDGVPAPKVIDFGVAKATAAKLTEKTMFTGVGQLIGTLEYMSPEQAQFNQLDVDTRSDIYSLGVLLYELLTGSTPFRESQRVTMPLDETLRIVRDTDPPRPSIQLSTAEMLPVIAASRGVAPTLLHRQVTGDLDWIVMKSLERDRRRRYDSASALAADVTRYLHDERVLASPPTMAYQLRKFVRRNKGPALAATLVLLAMLGGIIGTTWQMIRATTARATAVKESNLKELALAAARASELDAKEQLFSSLLNEAQARRFSRQIGQRLEGLAALTKAAAIRPDERLRDEAIAALALPDLSRVPVSAKVPAASTSALAFDDQYRMLARADTQGFVTVRDIADDHEIARIPVRSIVPGCLGISADGRFLSGIEEGFKLAVWRLPSGERVVEREYHECWARTFSPDGRRLAVSQSNRVIIFELATGREVIQWMLPAKINTLEFHPDGTTIAVGRSSGNVVSIHDVATGTVVKELPVGGIGDQVVSWHPRGELLAVTGAASPRIQIWNVVTKRRVAVLDGHTQHVPVLTFHPDGALLASHSWDGVLRLWDTATGRSLIELALTIGGRPRFSGDGRWLGAALNGDVVELLKVTSCPEYRTLVSSAGIGTGASSPADISPDGRFLIVGKATGMAPGACLWDLKFSRELALLPPGTNFVLFDARIGSKSTTTTPAAGDAEEGRSDLSTGGVSWSLLTAGPAGLQRWPANRVGSRISIGPPRQLSKLQRAWMVRGRDGQALGAATEEGGRNQIVDFETGSVVRELGVHPQGEIRAVSADVRWGASSGWHSDRVRLWDVHTGEVVREWQVGTRTFVFFTPDSRALIISRGDALTFWDLATLQPTLNMPRDVAIYPSHVAFSADGKLMAVETAPGVMSLKEATTGRTIAKFKDPHGDRASWQGFTPDGTRLVVVTPYANAIHIWDLRAIRETLKVMNLDWDWPEFDLAGPVSPHTPLTPVTFEVVSGVAAPIVLTREQRLLQVAERFRQNPTAIPDTAKDCNEIAWALLTAPPEFRQVEDGVRFAEKALELEPVNGTLRSTIRNTLGVAYYRAGRYREAVEVLRENLASQLETMLAFDLYFLALCHQRLGEPVQARDYYDLAVRWSGAQKNLSADHMDELAMFKAEADQVLGERTE